MQIALFVVLAPILHWCAFSVAYYRIPVLVRLVVYFAVMLEVALIGRIFAWKCDRWGTGLRVLIIVVVCLLAELAYIPLLVRLPYIHNRNLRSKPNAEYMTVTRVVSRITNDDKPR